MYWEKDRKKWHAMLAYNKTSYHGGYFDNEKHAGMSINLLCDKFGIKRKNLTIDIEPNIIQKVIHLLCKNTVKNHEREQ